MACIRPPHLHLFVDVGQMSLHHTLGDAQVLAYGAVATGLADLGNFRSIRTETGRESKRGEYGEMISKPL